MIDLEIPVEFQFTRQPWREDAACNGLTTDIFFPERGEPTEPAKAICFGCPVKVDCLTWALDNFVKIGVYGGRSERERRQMRRQRRLAARRGEVYVISAIDEEPRLPTVFRRPRLRPAQGLAPAMCGLAARPPRRAVRPTQRKGAGLTALLRVAA